MVCCPSKASCRRLQPWNFAPQADSQTRIKETMEKTRKTKRRWSMVTVILQVPPQQYQALHPESGFSEFAYTKVNSLGVHGHRDRGILSLPPQEPAVSPIAFPPP
jgi:hypothetical protein